MIRRLFHCKFLWTVSALFSRSEAGRAREVNTFPFAGYANCHGGFGRGGEAEIAFSRRRRGKGEKRPAARLETQRKSCAEPEIVQKVGIEFIFSTFYNTDTKWMDSSEKI